MENGALTALGQRLMKLPVHPRIGRLICAAADAGCPEEGAALGALLSEKDFRRIDPQDRRPAMQADSDLLIRLDDLHAGNRGEAIDFHAMRLVEQTKRQLEKVALRMTRGPRVAPSDRDAFEAGFVGVSGSGLPKCAGDPTAAAMVGGGGVKLCRSRLFGRPNSLWHWMRDRSAEREPPGSRAHCQCDQASVA